VAGVLVGHTHFDHAVDAPAIARRFGCKAYGSDSLVALMGLHGLADQAVEVEPYRTFELGPFEVSFTPSVHSKLLLGLAVPYDGDLTCEHLDALSPSAYRCGQVWGISIEVAGVRFYHQGSANLIDDAVRERDVDVFLAGVAGRNFTPDYWKRILPRLDPRIIVPTHYDNFFRPLGKPMEFVSNVQLSQLPEEIASVSEDAQIAALPRADVGTDAGHKRRSPQEATQRSIDPPLRISPRCSTWDDGHVGADYTQLPPDLPAPEDDGAADHLIGEPVPQLRLPSTLGEPIDLSEQASGRLVAYVYPRTGTPGQPSPAGWDDIPGARGCTPQSCAYRDNLAEFTALGTTVIGISAQNAPEQREFADREHIPFPLLGDNELQLGEALLLPTFEVNGMTLYKRLTFVAEERRIVKVFYPVFPPDRNAAEVLGWLSSETA